MAIANHKRDSILSGEMAKGKLPYLKILIAVIANVLKEICKRLTTLLCTYFCIPFLVLTLAIKPKTFGAQKTNLKFGKTGWLKVKYLALFNARALLFKEI